MTSFLSLTYLIIFATSAISIAAFNNSSLFSKLAFSPYLATHKKQWYRMFTHAFVHADWGHLFVNMFVLHSFGSTVEEAFTSIFGFTIGEAYFILLYVGAFIASSLPSVIKHKNHSYYTSVGASGAVSAIVFSSIIINPTAKLMLLILPIPMPAYIFGILYLGYEYFMSKKGNDNIAHDAHYAGAIYGIILTIILEPALLRSFIENVF